jgi:hypothetical protein
MKNKFIICFILFLVIGLMADIIPPKDNFVKGWLKSGQTLRFTKNDLYGHINGGAELFLEFGFNELLVQRYEKGGEEITLEIYIMDSPDAALGIYLMKCGNETPIKDISIRNSANRYQFVLVKGDYFILVNSFSGNETLIPVMVELTKNTLTVIPQGNPVKLLECLPEENLVAGSERIIRGPYALQPIFTFGKGDIFKLGGKIFGVVGEYNNSKGKAFCTRIIIPYPQKEDALSAYQNLAAKLDPYLKIINKSEKELIFKDYSTKFGKVKLNNNVIEIMISLSEKPE